MSGPRLTFFSGGTALRALSRTMAKANVASFHLVSTFDSGGSSAELRRVFAIPAVGDIRNRLLALANPDTPQAMLELCASRLPKSGDKRELLKCLGSIANPGGDHWRQMPKESADILRYALGSFLKRMPEEFNPAGASIGNLMLTGLYLEMGSGFAAPVALLGGIFGIHGAIAPITEACGHMAALLENNEYIVGQHLFGKLPAPVKSVFLTVHNSIDSLHKEQPPVYCHPPLLPQAEAYLKDASIICYPMGSFYSSILVNLLTKGCGRAIAKSRALKIFIPNSGHDPESAHLTIDRQAALLLKHLHEDYPEADNTDFLHFILLDSTKGQYPGGLDKQILRQCENMGAKIMDKDLMAPDCRHDPEKLLNALFEMDARYGKDTAHWRQS